MLSGLSIKEQIVEVGRRLYENRFIAAGDGNISARDGDRLFFTPTGTCKGFLKVEDIVTTDLQGRKLEGTRNPSSEALMHLEIYSRRPDVAAVVHAHPPYSTGYAVAGFALDKALLPEVILTMGCIPLAEYSTPTTEEVARAIRDLVPHHDALLLSNHGAVTYGKDMETAYFKMETLEHFARISIVAKILGRENVLSQDALKRLYASQYRENEVSASAMMKQKQLPGCPISSEEISGPAPEPANARSRAAGPAEEKLTLTRAELFEIIDRVMERIGRA